MKCSKTLLYLYAITDPDFTAEGSFMDTVEAALKGGITCLQLREKNLSEPDYIKKALAVKALCAKYNVPLIINDHYMVALKSGADGVHIGQQDADAAHVRRVLGPDMILGVTAKTVNQALTAEKNGADYLGSGAMFPSPTKPGAVGITPHMLRSICNAVSIPVCAIGGIEETNLSRLRDTGISGIAMASGIFVNENVVESCERIAAASQMLFGGNDDC